MHLLKSVEADNRHCQICQPPPAPQKPFLQKNIEISSRVRRKLNFDFFADDCEEGNGDHLQIKRLKINLPTTFLNTGRYHQQQHSNNINNNLKNSSSSTNSDPPTAGRTTMLSPKINFHRQNDSQSSETTNSDDSLSIESLSDTSIYSTPDQTETTTTSIDETKKSPIDQ